MNKRGQFFLMAALIIIAILVALSRSYTNTRTNVENIGPEILAGEMSYELAKAVDFSLYSHEPINNTLENLTLIYATMHKDKDIAVVYGYPSQLNATYYQSGVKNPAGLILKTPSPNSAVAEANITLDSGKFFYSFNLTQGVNVFVVVKEKQGAEVYVAVR